MCHIRNRMLMKAEAVSITVMRPAANVIPPLCNRLFAQTAMKEVLKVAKVVKVETIK